MSEEVISLYRNVRRKMPDANLTELFPALVILATEVGDASIERWARYEMGGYFDTNPAITDNVTVPTYRNVSGYWNDDYGRPLIIRDDPELSSLFQTYRLHNGVAELERMAKGHQSLSIFDQNIPRLIRDKLHCEVSMFTFQPADVVGVLTNIRMEYIDRVNSLGPAIEASGVAHKPLPDKTESISPPSYSITVTEMKGGIIQQAGAGAVQFASINERDLDAIRVFIEHMKSKQTALGLDAEQKSNLEGEIATVEAQLKKKSPTFNVIELSLNSILHILEGAGGVIAAELINQITGLLGS